MTDRERLQAAIDEALAHLGERATSSAAATAELPERIVDRTEAAVRKKLGDTIYDLARRCAAADPEVEAFTTFGGAEPATGGSLRAKASLYNKRIQTGSAEPTAVESSPDTIVTLDQAIDVLERLEGRSDSSEYLRCLRDAATSDWESLLSRSRKLARSARANKWRYLAGFNAVVALLRLDRFDEAVRESEMIASRYEPTRGLLFNRACAHAHLRDEVSFRRVAAEFVNCTESEGDDEFWRRQVLRHRDLFESGIGMTASDVSHALGLS